MLINHQKRGAGINWARFVAKKKNLLETWWLMDLLPRVMTPRNIKDAYVVDVEVLAHKGRRILLPI